MPEIFPKDKLFTVGERVKEYNIGLNLSAKSPNTDSIVGFSITTAADLKAQNFKRIKYDLIIPKINSSTNGNNSAEWIFFEDEAIGKNRPI